MVFRQQRKRGRLEQRRVGKEEATPFLSFRRPGSVVPPGFI